MENAQTSRWLSIRDITTLTGRCRATINNYRADPKAGFPLPFERMGRVLFVREDIEAWMERQENNRRQRIKARS